MAAVNYVIYGCTSSRTTPSVITIQDLHTGGKNCCSYYSSGVIDDNLKKQIKNRTFILVDYSY